MGTRAVTNVVDEKGDVYVSLYRQFDGYTQGGHGEELADFLEGATIGNGIRGNEGPKFFNGVGDLALRLVTFFRQDHRQCGGFYLIPPGTDWGPDFIYTLTGARGDSFDTPGTVRVAVSSYSRHAFEGTVEEFKAWILADEDDE